MSKLGYVKNTQAIMVSSNGKVAGAIVKHPKRIKEGG
jgi:hypothetical protein